MMQQNLQLHAAWQAAGVRQAVPLRGAASAMPLVRKAVLGAARRIAPCSRPAPAVVVRAAADTQAPAKPVSPTQGEPEWFALVANADFYFNDIQNEALAEQLRELKRYYEEIGRELDFFFVSEPAWLGKFPEDAKLVKRPCVALVSTDKMWITFMKLRLDRVLKLDLGNMPINAVTKSTAPVPEFKTTAKWIAPYSRYAPGWWEIFMRE